MTPRVLAGRYTMTEQLGEGGMARVYRGYDHRLKVWRAIKVLEPALADRRKLRARFEAEAVMMASLEHPHIVRVYDTGVDGEAPWIAMELVEGGSPADWLDRHGAMPPRLALAVTIQVCMAIQHAHVKGVVHRDIKPHNVLVTTQGVCKVSDFGIAHLDEPEGNEKLTRTGSMMGTFGFMAPEQRMDASSVDARADIYAIGAMLTMLVTNDVPTDLFAAAQDESLLAPLPPELRDVVLRATAYRRDDRQASATELANELARIRSQLPPDPGDTPSLVLGSARNPPRPAAPATEAAAVREEITPSTRWKNLPGDPRQAGPTIAEPSPQDVDYKPPSDGFQAPSQADRGPPVTFELDVGAGPKAVVHLECEPKRLMGNGRPLEGTVAILGMLGERRLSSALAAAAKSAKIKPTQARCWVQQGRGFKELVSLDDLARRTAPLEEHADACSNCKARVEHRAFGCIVQTPSVLSAAGEEWLIARLQPADQLGGALCLDSLKNAGWTGARVSGRRTDGLLERKQPLVVVLQKGWIFNTKITSDQVLEALLWREGGSPEPGEGLDIACWFGAVKLAGQSNPIDDRVWEQLRASPKAHRLSRTTLDIGEPSKDHGIRAMQRAITAWYLSWVHDVRLILES